MKHKTPKQIEKYLQQMNLSPKEHARACRAFTKSTGKKIIPFDINGKCIVVHRQATSKKVTIPRKGFNKTKATKIKVPPMLKSYMRDITEDMLSTGILMSDCDGYAGFIYKSRDKLLFFIIEDWCAVNLSNSTPVSELHPKEKQQAIKKMWHTRTGNIDKDAIICIQKLLANHK